MADLAGKRIRPAPSQLADLTRQLLLLPGRDAHAENGIWHLPFGVPLAEVGPKQRSVFRRPPDSHARTRHGGVPVQDNGRFERERLQPNGASEPHVTRKQLPSTPHQEPQPTGQPPGVQPLHADHEVFPVRLTEGAVHNDTQGFPRVLMLEQQDDGTTKHSIILRKRLSEELTGLQSLDVLACAGPLAKGQELADLAAPCGSEDHGAQHCRRHVEERGLAPACQQVREEPRRQPQRVACKGVARILALEVCAGPAQEGNHRPWDCQIAQTQDGRLCVGDVGLGNLYQDGSIDALGNGDHHVTLEDKGDVVAEQAEEEHRCNGEGANGHHADRQQT
mmetsp:Transcript_104299/g.331723  ORF Transcript_104299/g.331723 Transcript_104299/m.331723 type:complete len:335 (+) Transcript_104299:67-1071(+)